MSILKAKKQLTLIILCRLSLRTWASGIGANKATILTRTAGTSTTERTLEFKKFVTAEFRFAFTFLTLKCQAFENLIDKLKFTK